MIAVLHYAFLKGMRDRSLPVFFLVAPAQVAAMLIGFSVINRHLQYPLMKFNWDDGDVRAIAVILPSVIATLSAFWTFRSEVATKAIGSFVIASRPITIVVALVVFAAATASGGLIAAIVTVSALTAGLPANFVSMAPLGLMASLVGASLGALYVTISPQPAMLAWAFIAGLPLAPWIIQSPSSSRMVMIAAAVPIVCIAISAVLLRRRCAT